MTASRSFPRTLSAYKSFTRLWTPVSSRYTPNQVTHQLALGSHFSLTTWNLDAFSPRPVKRAKLLLDGVLKESNRPDILFLQEVTSDVRSAILDNQTVREAFLVTDAEDETSFEGMPFANMTLLSNKRFAFHLESQEPQEDGRVDEGTRFIIGPVSRVKLPSKYGRCALSVDIIPPSTPYKACRLINVHLDSLGDTLPLRTEQMTIIANLLREPGCGGGLIAGDFNAIFPEDHALVDENGLVDAWLVLHGKEGLDGATWGIGGKRHNGRGAGRLDKVSILGIAAKQMEVLHPGLIEVPKPGRESSYIPYSDHCGPRLGFTV